MTQLEQQRVNLDIKAKELQLRDDKVRSMIRAKGRHDGMADLWELSGKSKHATSQNEEAIQRLDVKIRRLRSEIESKEAEAQIMTN